MRSFLIALTIMILSLPLRAQNWILNNSTESVTEQIMVISSPNEEVCWYITNFDNLYKTIDSGDTWEKVPPTATSFNPSGVYVIDEDVAFKSSNQQLFRTINGGLTWTSVFTGNFN